MLESLRTPSFFYYSSLSHRSDDEMRAVCCYILIVTVHESRVSYRVLVAIIYNSAPCYDTGASRSPVEAHPGSVAPSRRGMRSDN